MQVVLRNCLWAPHTKYFFMGNWKLEKKKVSGDIIRHSFHIVDESPWPVRASLAITFVTFGALEYLHVGGIKLLTLGTVFLLWVSWRWWGNIATEGTYLGCHSSKIQAVLRTGIILFILSEVIFFVRFFWGFFHRRVSPTLEAGLIWPPRGVEALDPNSVPLLNTIILLTSGIAITRSHHAIIIGKGEETKLYLFFTIFLGAYFTYLQKWEYDLTSFAISDSIYGSTFFLITGFHGLHVIVGTIFLLVILVRMVRFRFRAEHHFGFEAAAWYWHFVDVVWLFLYIRVYWWGIVLD